jgi:hypothetical protein
VPETVWAHLNRELLAFAEFLEGISRADDDADE